ncbi:MAG TPA: carotenoid oxygenase family protein [Candidatus Limnocylindria bacterium]|nr:carotenoid oxygenase family protein [Candidatus Limnocylindria bacterium]
MYEPARTDATAAAARLNPWTPVVDEHAYAVTRIEGEVPRELHGTLFRNGPSQRVKPVEGYEAMHLFDGDGLVHAFRIADGRVHYTSRFVRDDSYVADERLGPSKVDFLNFRVGEPAPDAPLRAPHNTNVVWHHGRLMAMVEADHPWEMDPRTLASRGRITFTDPPLGMSVTAHPKIDGRTGQLVIHGYQPFPPFVQLYVVEPDGRCSLAETVDTPYSVMMHDLALTEHYVIFLLCPVLLDVLEGRPFRDWLRWAPELGLKFGVRARTPGAPIRWFEAPTPGYIFHPGNAFEDGDRIVMDACTYLDGAALLAGLAGVRAGECPDNAGAVPFLYELDLASGTCRERQLDDRSAEFPRLDDRLVAYRNRYGYAVMADGPNFFMPGELMLVKYDRQGGRSQYHRFGRGHFPGEPVFVPRAPDAAEDDGFVLSVVADMPAGTSYLAVLDARDLDAPPLAVAHLEHRVPLGFHGNFAAGVV